MRYRSHIFLLMLALFPTARLAAQAEAATWSLRVAAINIAGSHHTLWLQTGEGKAPVEVPLNTRVFSPPIEYKGPAALAFYRSAEEASAKEPPASLAAVVVQSSPSLILFSPRQDQENYEAFAIADAEFRFGSFRLVNFSTANIRADLLGKRVLLKSGAAETFAFPEGRNNFPLAYSRSRTVRSRESSGRPNGRSPQPSVNSSCFFQTRKTASSSSAISWTRGRSRLQSR